MTECVRLRRSTNLYTNLESCAIRLLATTFGYRTVTAALRACAGFDRGRRYFDA